MVRRATPGDIDRLARLVVNSTPRGSPAPPADLVEYVYSLIVVRPSVEIYLAELGSDLQGFLTVQYFELVSRGSVNALITELLVVEGGDEASVASGLVSRTVRAAQARRCEQVEAWVGAGRNGVEQALRQLGFEATATGFSIRLR